MKLHENAIGFWSAVTVVIEMKTRTWQLVLAVSPRYPLIPRDWWSPITGPVLLPSLSPG